MHNKSIANMQLRGSAVYRLVFYGLLFVSLITTKVVCVQSRDFRKILERLFCSVDQDGDGVIRHTEATKFLDSIGRREMINGYKESKDPFIHSSGFSYGGTTISAHEMLDHLQNMLTSDRVAEWLVHGLQLPQYAEAFRKNAINGLDFPALIEDDGLALVEELGVQSPLHRKKIIIVLVAQIFGLGSFPGSPENLRCESFSANGILLYWKQPAATGHPPLHKYVVERWDNGSSTWILRGGNVKENHFLDKIDNPQKTMYSYRVRTWGGHGPSDWSLLHACHVNHKKGHVIDEGSGFNISLEEAYFISSALTVYIRNTVHWISFINGGILILSVMSRHRYFFRYMVALWSLFEIKFIGGIFCRNQYWESFPKYLSMFVMTNKQQSGSRNLIYGDRTALISDGCEESETTTSHRVDDTAVHDDCHGSKRSKTNDDRTPKLGVGSVTTEAQVGMDSNGSNCQLHDQHSHDSCEHNDFAKLDNVELTNMSHDQDDELINCFGDIEKTPRKSGAKLMDMLGVSLRRRSRKHDPRMISRQSFDVHGASFPPLHIKTGDIYESWSASKSFKLPTSTHGQQSRQARKMCSFDGCKSRFDRFLSLSDWHMNFSKHYCCQCQHLYCDKHIRIAPHSSLGRCGLDSTCICLNCFEQLTTEMKEKLETLKKTSSGPLDKLVSSMKKKRQKKRHAKVDCTSVDEDFRNDSFSLNNRTDFTAKRRHSFSAYCISERQH